MQEELPLAISPLAGFLKIDQIAFLARSYGDVAAIKKQFRLTDASWTTDTVVARGYVRGSAPKAENTAQLHFNYDLGVELEILHYVDGDNYPDVGGVPSCHLCHIGAHVQRDVRIPAALQGFVLASPIIQQVETISHTNSFLVSNGRRYKYTIYDTRLFLGVYFKVIERIEKVQG